MVLCLFGMDGSVVAGWVLRLKVLRCTYKRI